MSNTLTSPIDAGAIISADNIARVIDGLRTRTLPKPEWTHGAHLVAGSALLKEFGLARAEQEMPPLIRAYNEATGVANTDSEGYHHTITLFFLRQINHFMSKRPKASLPMRITDLLTSPMMRRDYPFTYYTKDRLFSVEARRAWMAPDLRPLDD